MIRHRALVNSTRALLFAQNLQLITGFEVAIGVREDIWNELKSILGNAEGIRIAMERDLSDKYPCSPGSYFGQDVAAIVKPGHYKKNKDLIEKLKAVFNK